MLRRSTGEMKVRFTNTGREWTREALHRTTLSLSGFRDLYRKSQPVLSGFHRTRAEPWWHLVLDRRVSIFHVACVVLINPRESIILKKHCAWYQHHAPTRCLLRSIHCTGRGGGLFTGNCTPYRYTAETRQGRPARRARDKGDDGRLSAAPYRATVCGYLLGRRTA